LVFRWRKKNEDFEWRTYVRTTILVRRQERRQRAEDVKAAAVFGVKKAGKKGVGAAGAGLKSAGQGSLAALKWSGRRLRSGFAKSGAGIAASAQRGAAGARAGWVKGRAAVAPKLAAAGSVAGSAAYKVAEKLEPATAPLREPGLQLALKIIAAVSAIGAAIRAAQFGLDGHAWAAVGVALIAGLVLLATGGLPRIRPVVAIRGMLERLSDALLLVPGFDRFSERGAAFAALAVIALSAGGILWWQRGPLTLPSSFTASQAQVTPKPSRDPSLLEGYATVQSGDTVRLAGTTVVLDGIEAPDRSQTCSKLNTKRWDCAGAARDALSRLVRSKRIVCTLTSDTGNDVRTGNCQQSGRDIAAELVRNGHVFAKSGFFAAYSKDEVAAQKAKTGLWSGDALRPADWRAARWAEAKTKAPDGCPIKGQVFRKTGKVYMLPWSPDYERTRIDKTQGERWFCSESEAVSAGWKPL
jgi:endonuclease YncB( thermonuclease family)